MRTLRAGMGLASLIVLIAGCSGNGSDNAEKAGPASDVQVAADASSTQAAGQSQRQPLEEGQIVPIGASETTSVTSSQAEGEKIGGLEFEGGETAPEDEEDDEGSLEVAEPTQGSPQWILREIAKLQLAPFPNTEDVAKLRAARLERNRKIIDLAAQVIKDTHSDAKQTRVFDAAVNYMLDARLQSALQGDRESVDSLYDDAASLWERDKESKSAAEAGFALVNLAYANARNATARDQKWLKEFARQANHFLENFPKEQRRSIPLAFTAARSCELHGLKEEAIKSYTLIQKTFPESDQASRVKGILRRLNLTGRAIKLGGPTLDGSHVSLEQLAGKPVVIVFWSEQAKPFLDEVPQLLAIEQKFGPKGVTLLGVCLDQDQTAASKFVEQQGLKWTQIFYSDPAKSGWNNPVANYYGILEVGNWLVDGEGRVISTSVKASDLESHILPLLKRGTPRRESKVPPQ